MLLDIQRLRTCLSLAPHARLLKEVYWFVLRQETDADTSRLAVLQLLGYELLRSSTHTRRLQYIDRVRTKQHELQAALNNDIDRYRDCCND